MTPAPGRDGPVDGDDRLGGSPARTGCRSDEPSSAGVGKDPSSDSALAEPGASSGSAVVVSGASADGLSSVRRTDPLDCKSYFVILARTVLRVIPRIAAVREMFQPVWVNTSLRRCRSHAAKSPGDVVAGCNSAAVSKLKAAAGISAVGHSSTARSTTLLSSRTFPGHRYARIAARASGLSVLSGTAYLAHERVSACSARRSMSSPSSRNGGNATVTTASR